MSCQGYVYRRVPKSLHDLILQTTKQPSTFPNVVLDILVMCRFVDAASNLMKVKKKKITTVTMILAQLYIGICTEKKYLLCKGIPVWKSTSS